MKRPAIKQCVRFKGNFRKDVRNETPGQDLADFLAARLKEKSFTVLSVEDEEIWFTVTVASGMIKYPLMVSLNSLNEDYWEISCPCTLGFFARLFGKSEDTELSNLVNALNEILQEDKTITNIKWFVDYEALSDSYAEKPFEKRLQSIGKLLYKLVLPVCLTGFVLGIIGVILHGTDSILARIGVIMFMLPIASYFGFIVISILWGLIDDIRESFQKKTKKHWLRWLFAILIIAAFILPIILGHLSKNSPTLDKIGSLLFEKILFSFMALIFFTAFVFIFGSQIIRSLSRIFIPRYKKKARPKELLFLVGSVFALAGFTGFLSGFFAAFGLLKWIPQSIEFPLADAHGIDVDGAGNLFVASGFYSRIQMYNPKGEFVRGWFLTNIGGGAIKMRINHENYVEVVGLRNDGIEVFDQSGTLLQYSNYNDNSFWESFDTKGNHFFDKSTGCHYDLDGWVFTKVTQTGPNGEKSIGENAFYIFPFHGPAQAGITIMAGMLLMGWVDKKKKRKN